MGDIGTVRIAHPGAEYLDDVDPCPGCGQAPITMVRFLRKNRFFVTCRGSCKTWSDTFPTSKTRVDAIGVWHRRLEVWKGQNRV